MKVYLPQKGGYTFSFTNIFKKFCIFKVTFTWNRNGIEKERIKFERSLTEKQKKERNGYNYSCYIGYNPWICLPFCGLITYVD